MNNENMNGMNNPAEQNVQQNVQNQPTNGMNNPVEPTFQQNVQNQPTNGMNNPVGQAFQPNVQSQPTNGMNNPVEPTFQPNVQSQPINGMNNPVGQAFQPNVQSQPTNGMNNPVGPTFQPNVQSQPTNGMNNKTLYIIIAVVAVAVLAIVAYLFMKKDKVLTCTMETDMYGMEMVAEAKVKFKNDKADSADMTMTIDLGEYESQKDYFIENFEEGVEEYKEQGIDYDVTSKGSKVIVKMSAKKENFAKMDLNVKSENYKSVKKDLEDSGFTCK